MSASQNTEEKAEGFEEDELRRGRGLRSIQSKAFNCLALGGGMECFRSLGIAIVNSFQWHFPKVSWN